MDRDRHPRFEQLSSPRCLPWIHMAAPKRRSPPPHRQQCNIQILMNGFHLQKNVRIPGKVYRLGAFDQVANCLLIPEETVAETIMIGTDSPPNS